MNRFNTMKNHKHIRSGINFVRNVAGTKLNHPPSSPISKNILNPMYPTASTLVIILIYPSTSHPQNLIYEFDSSTTVKKLMNFLHAHIKEEFVYFSSGNLHIDYFLTLPHRLVKDLPMKKLKLVGKNIVDQP